MFHITSNLNAEIIPTKKDLIKNDVVKFGKKGKLLNEGFKFAIDDFYLTDAITKSSKVMNKCSKQLKRND